MKSDGRLPVAIVGGGFSGTILAASLARRGIHSTLIDGSGRAGVGVAYSTTEPAHLLNVRAEGMSAWAGDPDHFARVFEAEGGDRRGFAERRLFGSYLREILDHAVGIGRTEVEYATVIGARREGGTWHIELDNGRRLAAAALVLATGNQEPEPLGAFKAVGDRYINNPWAGAARTAVSELAQSGGSALLIGTGLTMVDLALSLDAQGFRGRIVALSRRGLIPRGHADFEPAPVELAEVPIGDLRGLWRWLRRRSARVGWRAAVDSLRPFSHTLWQGLRLSDQRRFMRHARPWWDVHRHRIAPQVADTVHGMIAEGRLEVLAGRITGASAVDAGLYVEIRRRGKASASTEHFDYVFNCTGPLHSVALTRNPLLRALLDGDAARPDQLGIGLEVDEHSRVAGGENLWALGPLTKGRYWEIIAVPDIREQAAAVAEDISRELDA
jgi:uncharacterized NAD(P)/FAD-binding protein YdhS